MAPLHGLAQVRADELGRPEIEWATRSLRSFAEEPLNHFVGKFDLIVFDYPFSGEALARGWLRPLDELLPADLLASRRAGCVGRTYDSYLHEGRLAALPLDAATHVCAWRPDLLAEWKVERPEDWDETVELAARTGGVVMPLTPTAVWGAVIDLCANQGASPLRPGAPAAFDRAAALDALGKLRLLLPYLPDWCFEASPVAVLNRMCRTNSFAFCPLAYGYAPYSIRGYAPHLLNFADMRIRRDGTCEGAILGGAGIGVLAGSADPEAAAALIAWLTSDSVQSTLYPRFAGQPAAAAAWDDDEVNAMANQFYRNTRASMDQCFHRPVMPGFHAFQTASATALHAVVRSGEEPARVLDDIDQGWRRLSDQA